MNIIVFNAAKINGIKRVYLGFIILQMSTTTQQSIIDITEVGIKTNITTVTPPKEFNPIKIAVYRVK